MKLSNTKVSTYRRCEKQFEFKYVLGLETKRKGRPRILGDWLHQLLMVHYDGHDWKEHLKKLKHQWNMLFEAEREDLGDLPGDASRIIQSYLYTYRRQDGGIKVLATELDEWVELPNGDNFNFIIDLVVQEPDGGIWLWDHKSSTSFMDPEYMLIESQLARYFWAFPRIEAFKGVANRLKGVMFNELRTKAPTIPETLQNGQLTGRANLDSDYYTYLKEIKRQGLNVNDYKGTLQRLKRDTGRFFRRTPMPKDSPVVKTMMLEMMRASALMKRAQRKGEFSRTPDKSCTWGCDFIEPCVAQLHGVDIKEIISSRYNVRKRPEEDAKEPKVTRRANGPRTNKTSTNGNPPSSTRRRRSRASNRGIPKGV